MEIKELILEIICAGVMALILSVVISKGINKSKNKEQQKNYKNELNAYYTKKSSLMTDCEKEYYIAIKKALNYNYIVQPQVNLASIINKNGQNKFANELFRNIDFGIFNLNYKIILLIEINDKTHEENKNRQARDYKVKEICEKAGIPLITFWTKYGINEEYIKKRINEYLQ